VYTIMYHELSNEFVVPYWERVLLALGLFLNRWRRLLIEESIEEDTHEYAIPEKASEVRKEE
jgi:hypothetical protein